MFYVAKEVDVMMLKKALLISFLVLLMLPIVLGQDEDFRPQQNKEVEKRMPEMRQAQDLDIEGLLSQVGLTQDNPPAEAEFMIVPDTGHMFGVSIHNDNIKYFYNDLNPAHYNGVNMVDKIEWLRMIDLRMNYVDVTDEKFDDDPIKIDIAGRLQPLIQDCKEDAFELAHQVNKVKDMFLFRQENGEFVANIRCADGTVPSLVRVDNPRFYGNEGKGHFINDADPTLKIVSRGEWPACTCTDDVVYCGYNLVYQCPKSETGKEVGFKTPQQQPQYATSSLEDSILPIVIALSLILSVVLLVGIVMFIKRK